MQCRERAKTQKEGNKNTNTIYIQNLNLHSTVPMNPNAILAQPSRTDADLETLTRTLQV
jgi:hypothetical protein